METQDKKETQLRSLAEIIATAGRNCEFLLELNKVSIYKITCNSNEAINENYKNFKWSLLTDPVSPFQIIWFSAFRHRWATITALWTDPPPPHMSRSGTYVQERGSTVHTDATTYVEHVPLKENGQHQITFFQAALCCWTPPAAGSQDRTQCCSLPVESIIVKHGRGITSAGGYKEIDALE